MSLPVPDPTLFADLACKVCERLYSSYSPPYDEIAFPICPTCRESREGCDDVGLNQETVR